MTNNDSTRTDNNIGDTKTNSDSFLLLTQYSYEASKLIKSFTKNFIFIILILSVIAVLTIIDLLKDLALFNILSDTITDVIIIVVAISLILFSILIARPLFRSRRILAKWSNLFDQNSIRTGIILSINNKTKEEVLVALSETIEQIAIPLQNYLAKSDCSEFYNVSIDDTTFDILIDRATIRDIDSLSLKNTISDYGSVLIKIEENTINKDNTQKFIHSLKKYKKRGNKIGLAILIGESVIQESYDFINKSKDKITEENIILIEKPSRNSDLMNLNKVLN